MREHADVQKRDDDDAGDQGDPAKRLHGSVHALELAASAKRLALLVQERHRLHRHRIGDDILDDVAGR